MNHCPACNRIVCEVPDDGMFRLIPCACGTMLSVLSQREYEPVIEVWNPYPVVEPQMRNNRIGEITAYIVALLDAAPDYEFAPVVFDELVSDEDVLRLHALGISNL